MALITCPDCQKQISDQATACPHCGRPTQPAVPPAQTQPPGPTPKTQTVEATGKMWKGIQLVGVLIICVGVISCIYQASSAPDSSSTGPTFFTFAGILTFVLGRLGGWWFHR